MKQEQFQANKLAALRAYHGLDQLQLARKTAISRATIQRLERGICKNPNLATLQALGSVL